MEVIKPGIPTPEQRYQGECHQCGAIVRFTESEAKTTGMGDRYVSCPTARCNTVIYGDRIDG